MNTARFDCVSCQQTIEAPAEMASLVIDCPSCGVKLTIPDATEERPQTKPDAVVGDLVARYRELHAAKYGERRAWDSDLALVFLLSPKTVQAWQDGDKQPNAQRLEKLRLLVKAMESGRPLKMWSKGEHALDIELDRLQKMKASGIRWVEVLGCGDPKRECDACRALKGKPIEIERAEGLPLPGCDLLECLCITIASEGPRIEVTCPVCGGHGFVRGAKRGDQVECPDCKNLFAPIG